MPRDDDDDRPRRRRRDDYDDRPRRSRRSRRDDDYDEDDDRPRRRSRPPEKQVSVLGIISLVKGIGALIASFIPCVGAIAILPGALGLVLGVIGLVVARKSNGRQGTGLPIAGISCSGAAIVVAVVWMVLMGAFSKKVDDAAAEGRQRREQAAEEVRTGPAVALTTEALTQAFNANRAKATADYKGRVVELTGTVDQVDLQSPPTVFLDDPKWAISCDFPTRATAELWGSVKKGARVTIRGRVTNIFEGGINLKDCALVK